MLEYVQPPPDIVKKMAPKKIPQTFGFGLNPPSPTFWKMFRRTQLFSRDNFPKQSEYITKLIVEPPLAWPGSAKYADYLEQRMFASVFHAFV